MKTLLIIMCCISIVGFAFAESYKIGPYPNYKGMVEAGGIIISVPTTMDYYINDPFGGTHHIAARGGQEFETRYSVPLFANSYVEFESSEEKPFNPKTGMLLLTEIWAEDLEPGGPPDMVPPTKGFDPQNPGVVPSGPGLFKGRSGILFAAPVQTVPVDVLPAVLPGYNVGMIMGGPGTIVYVVQAEVPASEFIIEPPSPYFLLDSQEEWQSKLDEEWPDMHLAPLGPVDWDKYYAQLMQWGEGEPYPPTQFLPPELHVYEGGGSGGDDPEDAGLVMKWGDETTPDGNYASAWKYDYGDPDLSNCTITVTATPPGPSGITQISLGLQDVNGNIRSWWWNVPAVIPYSTPTIITIDTSKVGPAATTPPASGFANNPAFDLTKVQSIIADENAAWVASVGAPPPGGTVPGIWNYWHNLMVTKNTKAYKGTYVKWSQPPVVYGEDADVPKINGWDEVSIYRPPQWPMMADDWLCTDERPITDLHWWGSFIGWTQPLLPPVLPKAFHIGIWTDVPAGADKPYSHPGVMVWEHVCDNWVWNFAGYDVDPRIDQAGWQKNEACFQFNQLLSQDDWFYQKPDPEGVGRVYWISISAIYDPQDWPLIRHPWGWKTRPHHFNDDAIRIRATADGIWPPKLGSAWGVGDPVEYPAGVSWDLAFELTTNRPGYIDNPIPGDIAGPNGPGPDKKVNLYDLALMASNWLVSAP